MSKKLRQIREDLLNTPHDNRAASGPDVTPKKEPGNKIKALAQTAQRPDKKWKVTALAGKQYEPNRTKARHPSVPHQRITGPNELGGMSEGKIPNEGKGLYDLVHGKHTSEMTPTQRREFRARRRRDAYAATKMKYNPWASSSAKGRDKMWEELITEMSGLGKGYDVQTGSESHTLLHKGQAVGSVKRHMQDDGHGYFWAGTHNRSSKQIFSGTAHEALVRLAKHHSQLAEDTEQKPEVKKPLTSDEGEFDAEQSNKDFAEKLKKMVYDQARGRLKEAFKKLALGEKGTYQEVEANAHAQGKSIHPDGAGGTHPRDLHHGKPVSVERDHDHGNLEIYRHDSDTRATLIGHIREETMKKTFSQLREALKPKVHSDLMSWKKHAEKRGHDLQVGPNGIHAYTHKPGKPGKLAGFWDHSSNQGWMNEGRESEYSANRHLSSTSSKNRKPGHYLMRHGVAIHNEPHATSQQALSAYHNLSDKSNVKIQHVREMTEQFLLGDKVCIDCDKHPRHGQVGTLQGVDHMGGHHVSFADGEHMPFEHDDLKAVQTHKTGSAVGSISSTGVAEDWKGALNYKTPGGHANHRAYGSVGYIHPDRVKYHKVGEHVDYYEHGTGDKKYGKVTKNDGKSIHIQRKHENGVVTSERFKVGHPAEHLPEAAVPRANETQHDESCPRCKEIHRHELKGGMSKREASELARYDHEMGHKMHAPYDMNEDKNNRNFMLYMHGAMSRDEYLSRKYTLDKQRKAKAEKSKALSPKQIKEDGVAMAAGAVGDPGHVQNATDNYAAQLGMGQKKKPLSMLRRRRPRPGSTMSGNKP